MTRTLRNRLWTATLFVACVVFSTLTAHAQLTSTTPEAAAAVARNWFQLSEDVSWSQTLDTGTPTLLELNHDGVLVGYVAVQNNGFVVLPAYTELPPVTAYSTTSVFNVGDEGGFVQMVKEQLAYKIEVARSVLTAAVPTPEMQPVLEQIETDRRLWSAYAADYSEFTRALEAENRVALDDQPQLPGGEYGIQSVEPLLQTVWSQNSPYNDLCPMGDGGRTLLGCVATAAAQIVAYWRTPSGTGTHSYTWAGDNSCGSSTPSQSLSASYADTYDWNNILNSYSGGGTTAQRAAAAELNYEVAVAFDMDFGRCGSGAYTGAALTVFPTYFQMASDIQRQNRNAYSTASGWFTMLQEDLNIGWPMQYRINSHSIVCDGWRVSGGNQIHLNYGWGGSYTAWYTVDNLHCPWSGCSPSVEYVIRHIHPINGGGGGGGNPTVTVSDPNGGEVFTVGGSANVTWTSTDLSENVNVELNRNYPTGAWETLAAATANDGAFAWTVSGAATSAARVRVRGATSSTVADVSDANFTINGSTVSASLTTAIPNGGEVWAIGTLQRIRWTSTNLTGYLRIELNRNYPSGTWETITAMTLNDGGHSWTVNGTASPNARIRVMSLTNAAVGDTSDANFTIGGTTPTRSITLSTPNGGETWTIGQSATVTWSSSGLSETVNIQLNRAYPSGTWETLASGTANDGTHTLAVGGAASTAARVRVVGTTSTTVGDTSNANFTIAASAPSSRSVTVLAPNGGEQLAQNSTVTIRWSSTNLTGYVRIQVNRNYPSGSWSTVISSTMNDGSYAWRTNGSASSNVRIRVMSTSFSTVGDTSDANFSIGNDNANGGAVPEVTTLEGAYPNPFNPSTQIRYTLAEAARVTMDVFDINGRQVASLVNEAQAAGEHVVRFDGNSLATGTYFLRMSAGSFNTVHRLLLMK